MSDKYFILLPEELVLCPYDKSHMVKKKRLPYHILKCQKQHPKDDFDRCRFNFSHVICKVDKRYHESVCPDRVRLELDLIYDMRKKTGDKVMTGYTGVPPYNDDCTVPSLERWEEGDDVMDDVNKAMEEVAISPPRRITLERYYLPKKATGSRDKHSHSCSSTSEERGLYASEAVSESPPGCYNADKTYSYASTWSSVPDDWQKRPE